MLTPLTSVGAASSRGCRSSARATSPLRSCSTREPGRRSISSSPTAARGRFCATGGATACAGTHRVDPRPGSPRPLGSGRVLRHTRCDLHHGPSAAGRAAPRDAARRPAHEGRHDHRLQPVGPFLPPRPDLCAHVCNRPLALAYSRYRMVEGMLLTRASRTLRPRGLHLLIRPRSRGLSRPPDSEVP